MNPSLSGGPQADADFEALVNTMWGKSPKKTGLRELGKGRLVWGADLGTTLADLGIPPDVSGARSAVWNHRRLGDMDLYFVAADRASNLDANLLFRAKGRPNFGTRFSGRASRLVVYHQDERGSTIPMQLPAAGSAFVVFHPEEASPTYTGVTLNGATLLDAKDTTRIDTAEPFPPLWVVTARTNPALD